MYTDIIVYYVCLDLKLAYKVCKYLAFSMHAEKPSILYFYTWTWS